MSVYDVRETKDKGRGLFATRQIETGFNIMVIVETPYVHVLADSERGDGALKVQERCDWCTKQCPNLKRCTACKLVNYCNATCQKAHWTSGAHKNECKEWRGRSQVPEQTNQLVSRVLRRLELDYGDDEAKPLGDNLISAVELESNYDKLTTDQQTDVGVFLARFEQTKKQRYPACVKTARKLLDLCAKLKNNQFAICDELLNSEVGAAVYLNASLINHSCRPNAFPIFDGTTLYIKALKKIEPGEEICISYTDCKVTTAERQEALFSIYRFNCTCPLCGPAGRVIDENKWKDANGKVLTKDDHAIKATETALSDMAEWRQKGEFEIMFDAVNGWMKRNILPDTNIFWLRLLEFAFDAAIEMKDWGKAVEYGARIIPGYKMFYGAEHPFLGLHLMKFGKIMVEIRNAKEADEMLRRAFGIMSIFFPAEHKMRADLNQLIMQSYEISMTEQEQKELKEKVEEEQRHQRHMELNKKIKKIKL